MTHSEMKNKPVHKFIELIVLRIRSHEALLEAAKVALSELEYQNGSVGQIDTPTIKQLKKAISEAESSTLTGTGK